MRVNRKRRWHPLNFAKLTRGNIYQARVRRPTGFVRFRLKWGSVPHAVGQDSLPELDPPSTGCHVEVLSRYDPAVHDMRRRLHKHWRRFNHQS